MGRCASNHIPGMSPAADVAKILATVNALLVTVSGILIVAGVTAARRGAPEAHARRMALATALLAVFLLLYVGRFVAFGITPFQGPAWAKPVYYALLVSHVATATLSTPLVLWNLLLARRGAVERHRRLGRSVYPLWLYVAATGPLVYLSLYYL